MTVLPTGAKKCASFAHGLFLWAFAFWMVGVVPSMALAGSTIVSGTNSAGDTTVGGTHTERQMSVNNRSTGYGIDPSTACTDVNQDQQITADECQGRDWNWTTTDPQVPINNQNGAGVPVGSGDGIINQDAEQTIKSGPHFTTRYYNKPSATNTTATSGFTARSEGALQSVHDEYGFEIVVDKKTDPLEPYYQRFQEKYAVDAQQDALGNMVGQGTSSYEKIVTEEDPNNAGVFNRYTVTGTATSGGAQGNYSSQCQSGCPAGPGGTPTDPETGWAHPWQ